MFVDYASSPKEVADVVVRWADFKNYLRKTPDVDVNETVATADWSAVHDDGTAAPELTVSTADIRGSKVYTVVQAGTTGTTYILQCHVVTSLGLEYTRTISITVGR